MTADMNVPSQDSKRTAQLSPAPNCWPTKLSSYYGSHNKCLGWFAVMKLVTDMSWLLFSHLLMKSEWLRKSAQPCHPPPGSASCLLSLHASVLSEYPVPIAPYTASICSFISLWPEHLFSLVSPGLRTETCKMLVPSGHMEKEGMKPGHSFML